MAPRGDPPRVIAFRRRLLTRAGLESPLADAVASDPRYDVHALLELIDRGCPPRLAVRILAPLDGPPAGDRHEDRG